MAIRGGARAHTNVDRPFVAPHPEAIRGSSDVGLFAELEPALFLVDGNNLLWRAAHSHPAPFDATDGRDLTPLFRFVTKLRSAVGTYGVFAECVVCFDGAEAWSQRVEADPSYKANREYESKDLSFMGWLPEIRAALQCMGIATIEVTDHEADDVIATLCATASAARRSVRILSTDRDYYQLISPTVCVIDTRRRPPLVGEREVVARFGVTPSQWCDFRALAGDTSDGIPGLPGVGMARAATLLAGGRALDDLRTDPFVGQHWDDVARWRELIRLRDDVKLTFEPRGEPTPRLPSASAVCAALGLV